MFSKKKKDFEKLDYLSIEKTSEGTFTKTWIARKPKILHISNTSKTYKKKWYSQWLFPYSVKITSLLYGWDPILTVISSKWFWGRIRCSILRFLLLPISTHFKCIVTGPLHLNLLLKADKYICINLTAYRHGTWLFKLNFSAKFHSLIGTIL